MVKGVNKRVIEVNNTGNKFFEKIVFYVTPEFSDLTTEQLRAAADYLSMGVSVDVGERRPTLRKRRKRRARRIFGVCTAAVLVVAVIILRLVM